MSRSVLFAAVMATSALASNAIDGFNYVGCVEANPNMFGIHPKLPAQHSASECQTACATVNANYAAIGSGCHCENAYSDIAMNYRKVHEAQCSGAAPPASPMQFYVLYERVVSDSSMHIRRHHGWPLEDDETSSAAELAQELTSSDWDPEWTSAIPSWPETTTSAQPSWPVTTTSAHPSWPETTSTKYTPSTQSSTPKTVPSVPQTTTSITSVVPQVMESTAYTTHMVTITRCGPEVPDCPARMKTKTLTVAPPCAPEVPDETEETTMAPPRPSVPQPAAPQYTEETQVVQPLQPSEPAQPIAVTSTMDACGPAGCGTGLPAPYAPTCAGGNCTAPVIAASTTISISITAVFGSLMALMLSLW